MRPSLVASAQACRPARHVAKAWACAVLYFLDVDPGRVREAYGEHTHRRLAEIKVKYDPDNTFHHNKNIPPAG
ncbi:BBE domain-containing protein [Streptomyces sp. F8]|uniref:BBE domain-containing protein n=1 Tax=Streptomyces sp. F8 TaxID=1436085 RepID=UPI0029CE63F6|nr:BBE domain-containing protein [Streptomyces sp. F8]MDX6757942.1 BBE domain-containing protein [Streptomyces sp. F8]